MDCRREKLTNPAIAFLQSQGCCQSQDVEEVRRAIPGHISISTAQIEAIANLAGVRYTTHTAHRAEFFSNWTLDKIAVSVNTAVFEISEEVYLGYCCPNGILETDDTMMVKSGALIVLGANNTHWNLCDSPYVVIEKDAFLTACTWPEVGHACLLPGTRKADLEEIFDGMSLYAPASDSLNAIWFSDDVVIEYLGWVHSVELHTIEAYDSIHIYGPSSRALRLVRERLEPLVVDRVRKAGDDTP